MYAVIAIHYPKPEHIEDFLTFMAEVETVAHGSPGMLRFGSWREDGGERLVGLSMWESKEAFEAFFQKRKPDFSKT